MLNSFLMPVDSSIMRSVSNSAYTTFAEMKGSDRSTDLFSLAEIRNVRKEDNFSKGYITGKYGAIPMLNVDFANIVSNM